jgi:hypothetical protein
MALDNNGFVTIKGIDRTATGESDVFPAYVDYSRGVANPGFDRATAERVVEWTNRANEDATCGETAVWDGDTIVLTRFDDYAPGEDLGTTRVTPNEHGRYHIGGDWIWETVEKFTTATHWNVTYWPTQGEGVAKWHKAPEDTPGAAFTVTDAGLVLFSTADATPRDVVSAVQEWITEND